MPLIEQFEITNCGSVVLFQPLTPDARSWWDDHVQDGPVLGDAFAVEHRFAADIVDGIWQEG